jgi:hypothetical protein
VSRVIIPDTVPIENLLPVDEHSKAYMAFSVSLPRPRNLVKIHQAKLGKQSTIFQSEYRMWVWIRSNWIVFVSNTKGICLEVPEGITPEKAREAWKDYVRAMNA